MKSGGCLICEILPSQISGSGNDMQEVVLRVLGAPIKSKRMRLSTSVCFLATLSILFAAGCAHAADGYRVVHTYPHDQQAFTQGLVYFDGHLYESTGRSGQSSLREEDVETGSIRRMQPVPDQYFAEGLTDWKNTLVQLTWQSHVGFVYDRATFRLLRTFNYDGEGWGLTHDSKSLILSDGTASLAVSQP